MNLKGFYLLHHSIALRTRLHSPLHIDKFIVKFLITVYLSQSQFWVKQIIKPSAIARGNALCQDSHTYRMEVKF